MTLGQIMRNIWNDAYADHLKHLRATVRTTPDYELQEKAQEHADEVAADKIATDAYAEGRRDGAHEHHDRY